MNIRPLAHGDGDGVWAVLEPIIRSGEVFAAPMNWSRDAALADWCVGNRAVYVAEDDGVVGVYYVRANYPGGGAHVANAGYAVRTDARGRGAGRSLCLHSLETARALGFRAMQFNFVVETNAHAVALWEKCGFARIGRLPAAFRRPQGDYVDACVMHRNLVEVAG